jgi:hypothetical protein
MSGDNEALPWPGELRFRSLEYGLDECEVQRIGGEFSKCGENRSKYSDVAGFGLESVTRVAPSAGSESEMSRLTLSNNADGTRASSTGWLAPIKTSRSAGPSMP